MSQSPSQASSSPFEQAINPNPAFQRLEKLLGTWDLTGRTLDSQTDNIFGQVTIEWMLDGFFLQQGGWIDFMGFRGESLEIISYDVPKDIFPAMVYSNMSPKPMNYFWDVQGNLVMHWTEGAKYKGTFNEDGTILSGAWRPAQDAEASASNSYDATMFRIK